MASHDLSDHMYHRNKLVQRAIACQPRPCGVCGKTVGQRPVFEASSEMVVWFRWDLGYFVILFTQLGKKYTVKEDTFVRINVHI